MTTIDSFRGDYEFLSNFYVSPMVLTFKSLPGRQWLMPTGEHAFQSAKVDACPWSDEDKITWLLRMVQETKPAKAKYLGRSIEIDVDKWNSMGDNVMRHVQRIKYTLYPNLRRLLLNTGDATLVEGNTWGDKYWGQVNGDGLNMLGTILMNLRTEMRIA